MTNPTLLPGVPLIESPLLPSLLDSLDQDEQRLALDLHVNGFATLEFPDPDFDSAAERIKSALTPQLDIEGWRQSGWAINVGLRIQDAWRTNADVRRLAVNAQVQALLSRLYGRRGLPVSNVEFSRRHAAHRGRGIRRQPAG